MPNYDAIRLYHRVETIYSDSETHRRLQRGGKRAVSERPPAARPWAVPSTGNRAA